MSFGHCKISRGLALRARDVQGSWVGTRAPFLLALYQPSWQELLDVTNNMWMAAMAHVVD